MGRVPEHYTVDETLDWAGQDVRRLHLAYEHEALLKPPQRRRQPLLAELSNRLGWPLPDTPEADVLAWAGRPGFPPARLLAVERARPARFKRRELITQLAVLVAARGENQASAVAPVTGFNRLFS